MLSTDRALFTGRCSILMKGNNWMEKQVVVIQNALIFFEKAQSFYEPEIFKLLTLDLQVFQARSDSSAEVRSASSQNNKVIVKLIEMSQKKAKLMSFSSQKEMEAFKNAVAISSYYAYYEALCTNLRIDTHSYVLKYIVELSQQAKAPFYFKEAFFGENIFPPIYEFLKKNSLIQNVIFQDFVLDEKTANIILQLITNFSRSQLTHFTMKSNGLTDEILDSILYGLGHQTYLEYLEISQNQLTDDGIVALSAIFEHMPSLKHLNVSNNQITGLTDLEIFLEAILRDLELEILDLSHNKLKDSTIDLFISYIFKQPELSIKEFDISRNDFSNMGHYKLIDSYFRCPNLNNMKLILRPLPFHSSILQRLLGNNKTIDITIERISLNNLIKRPPSKDSEFQNISEILKKINEMKGSATTVEEIGRICNKIYVLEYEFPPQKLELLHYVLRKKIQQALGETNYYATDVLLKAAGQVGLGIQEFEEDIKVVKARVSKLVSELTEVLNFQMSESSINEVLDLRLQEALNLGLRGHLIDTLLCIKEKRDEIIRNFDKDGYEEEEGDDNNAFGVLERDKEHAGKKGGIDIDLMRVDKCLLLHPAQVNYYELSKMGLAKLQEILKVSIGKLKEEENYFMRNAYNRCYFLLLASIENGRNFARKDKKLYNCRLIIQYRNYLHKKLEKQPMPPVIIYTISKIEVPGNVKDFIDNHRMSRFPYLRSLEDFIKKVSKSNNVDSEKSDTRRDSTKSTGQGGSKSPNMMNESIQRLPNSVLEFSMTPLPCSLVKFNQPSAENYALIINSLLLILVSVDKNTEDFIGTVQTIVKMVLEQDQSKYYELNDEVYLQFYKVTNRPLNSLTTFYHKNAFAGLALISTFILPESEMKDFVKSWMYLSVNDKELGIYSQRILLNILNSELPEFSKPFWVPSRKEIKDLLKFENQITVDIKLHLGALPTKSFTLSHTCTVGQLMEQVYALPQMAQVVDKYSFWLYKAGESTKANEDAALPQEAFLSEIISHYIDGSQQGGNELLVKRRVFCSVFTMNLTTLDKVYLESLYEDTFQKYAKNSIFGEYLKIEQVVQATSLLYLIKQKRKGKERIDVNKEKISKAVGQLIPRFYVIKKAEKEWVERIEGILTYNVKWREMGMLDLYREFIGIFVNSALFAASSFSYKKKDNIADRSLPIEGIVAVNIFGIFFFAQNHRDKPMYYLYFEELSYVLGHGNIFKISYIDRKFGSEVQATLETSHARELAEDIISYASVRNLEKNYIFYAFTILRDFEKVYIHRRATKSETDLEYGGEEAIIKAQEAIETNEIINITEAKLAFHEKLPLFDEEDKSNVVKRKIARDLPTDEDIFMTTPSLDQIDSMHTGPDSRRTSKHDKKGRDKKNSSIWSTTIGGVLGLGGIFSKDKTSHNSLDQHQQHNKGSSGIIRTKSNENPASIEWDQMEDKVISRNFDGDGVHKRVVFLENDDNTESDSPHDKRIIKKNSVDAMRKQGRMIEEEPEESDSPKFRRGDEDDGGIRKMLKSKTRKRANAVYMVESPFKGEAGEKEWAKIEKLKEEVKEKDDGKIRVGATVSVPQKKKVQIKDDDTTESDDEASDDEKARKAKQKLIASQMAKMKNKESASASSITSTTTATTTKPREEPKPEVKPVPKVENKPIVPVSSVASITRGGYNKKDKSSEEEEEDEEDDLEEKRRAKAKQQMMAAQSRNTTPPVVQQKPVVEEKKQEPSRVEPKVEPKVDPIAARKKKMAQDSDEGEDSEEEDKDDKRAKKTPAFNPYKAGSSTTTAIQNQSVPEPKEVTPEPQKPVVTASRPSDTSLAKRLAKIREEKSDDDEDEEDSEEERKKKKQMAAKLMASQMMAPPKKEPVVEEVKPVEVKPKARVEKSDDDEDEDEDSEEERKKKKQMAARLMASQLRAPPKKEPVIEEAKPVEVKAEAQNTSGARKALGNALSGALKSMPKFNKVAKPVSDDDRFFGLDNHEEKPQPKPQPQPQVKQPEPQPQVKQPEPQPKVEEKPKEEVKESKEKLGKALFGALKSMPKVKKIEKVSDEDQFYNH